VTHESAQETLTAMLVRGRVAGIFSRVSALEVNNVAQGGAVQIVVEDELGNGQTSWDEAWRSPRLMSR